jgi:hypothetical protein
VVYYIISAALLFFLEVSITFCFAVIEDTLYTSSSFLSSGDIMYIDIDKAIPKSNKLKRFTELHSRSVFGIDIVDDGRFAISHSMDRSVSPSYGL